MGKSNPAANRFINKTSGYSIVELMVVLAVIAAVGTMAFFGVRSFNSSQTISNVQKEFVTNLRTVQNRVDSGDVLSGGKVVQEITIPANGSSYTINGRTVSLQNGVTISNSTGVAVTVCFPDRNLLAYDNIIPSIHACASCVSGIGFICRGSSASSSPITVTFRSGSSTSNQTVTINGAGMRVTEINSGP